MSCGSDGRRQVVYNAGPARFRQDKLSRCSYTQHKIKTALTEQFRDTDLPVTTKPHLDSVSHHVDDHPQSSDLRVR